MIFTKTHRYQCTIPQQDFKSRLIGKHVTIHNMDFEIFEQDEALHIIPHAEQDDSIRTLPDTFVELKDQGGKTNVTIKSKIRELDAGGPAILLIVCTCMLIASGVLYALKETIWSYIVFGVCFTMFVVFWIRMQRGYFDYVRKIHNYVKDGVTAS